MSGKFITKFQDRVAQLKYCFPPDVFERHKFIGGMISKDATVLDAGGSLSRLGDFCQASKITTADIKPPADIIYNGKKIPVKDNSYDVVTSIDVLEHVPKNKRAEFITELYRVARKKLIISAPYGSQAHIKYETDLLAQFQDEGIDVPYLKEHVKIGLPTPQEIKVLRKKYTSKLFYAGSIGMIDFLTRLHNFETTDKYSNLAIFFLKLGFNCFFNVFFYPFVVNKEKSENINRFYLVIEKINK